MSKVYNDSFILANSIEEEVVSPNRVRFSIHPLESGFGTTIGNCLRRVLISSIDGVCFTSVQIEGVQSRIDNLSGVYQDVPEMIFNFRNVILKTELNSGSVNLKVKGPKVVTAGDLRLKDDIKVLNPSLVLFEITGNIEIDIVLHFKRGIGIKFVDFADNADKQIGKLEMDANYSPVTNVSFEVSDIRVGSSMSYEKLTIDLETNGSCMPREALDKALALLVDNFSKISTLRTLFDKDKDSLSKQSSSSSYRFNPNAFKLIQNVEMSVRSANALEGMNCTYLGDIAVLTQDEILNTPNLGRKSVAEIEAVLSANGLSFNTDMPWIRGNNKLDMEDFNKLLSKAQDFLKKIGDSPLKGEHFLSID